MSRNAFGIFTGFIFTLLVFAVFTQWERYAHGAHAPAMTVFVPAAIKTATVTGIIISVMIVILRASARRNK